jgi:hypothetical protein
VGTREDWSTTDPTYTAWVNIPGKVLYSCSNWTPSGSTVTTSSNFVQTASNCLTDQTRSRQDREKEANTGEIRNTGNAVTESQTLTGQQQSRAYSITIDPWTNSSDVTGCSNWSPDPSTVTINQNFTQTATDCKVGQTRVKHEAYVDPATGSTVVVSNTTESQQVGASSIRSAIGTKETWVATTSTYSAWSNTDSAYGCTAWSPSPSNYTSATQFDQTGSGCSVDQQRSRQDEQVETTTGAERANGSPVTETQTIGGQTSSRTYLMNFSGWTDSGGVYNCSAWTPDASTVASGTAFTQTANCSINQTRGAEGYTLVNGGWVEDPAVPYRTETQAIARSASQTATGTKITQECPAYSSKQNSWYWANPGKSAYHVIIYWGGTAIATNVTHDSITTYSAGGYTYTRGSSEGNNYYSVCRTAN